MPLFADDPATFFAGEGYKAHQLPRIEIEALQLNAAQARFDSLKDRLPPLQTMASMQGIDAIDTLAELAKLLFPQSFYKSYDVAILERGELEKLANWLQKLTSRPLLAVKGRTVATLDAFFELLDRECGVRLVHSSGTTGKLSFFPRGSAEWAAHLRHVRSLIPNWSGRPGDASGEPPFAVVWAGHAGGHSAILQASQLFNRSFARSPAHFHATMAGKISVDWQSFMMRLERAQRLGLPQAPVSDYVLARLDEMEEARVGLDASLDRVLDTLRDDLAGERVVIGGPSILVHQLASRGLARGIENVSKAGGYVHTFGGIKQHGPVPQLEERVARFAGVAHPIDNYGMTEMLGGATQCQLGHYHLQVTQVPFLFDLTSGALLTRHGRQTGRFGVFDTMAQGYWGGTVTADRLTVGWDLCPCGRQTPFVVGAIARCNDAEDDLPPFAATAAAVEAAYDVLSGRTNRPTTH